MNFRELFDRLSSSVAHPEFVVAWFKEGQQSQAANIVVPLGDGRFTLYHPSGRDDYYQDVDSRGNPRVFIDEAAVCEYVWAETTKPRPPAGPTRTMTQEELDAQRREVLESLGIRPEDDPLPKKRSQ